MYTSSLLTLTLASAAAASFTGFNYASTLAGNVNAQYQDFVNLFKTAASLDGAPVEFNSARLYTMIQAGTTNTPISALQAAQDTGTHLLLGLWASGDGFPNELAALKSAISQYSGLASSIIGIAVGSEDLYRISPVGLTNPNAGLGAGPSTIVDYINDVKQAVTGTTWSGVPVGHVDTWTAWVNGSNSAVVDACDFLGVDAYPYYQNTMPNSISDGTGLFNQAVANTKGAAKGKPVWVTETGWPVSGPVDGEADASLANAKTYWDDVGCPNFGDINIFWYTLQDAPQPNGNPSFGIVGSTLSETPLYDLSCKDVSVSSSSTKASATKASATKSAKDSATASGSGASTTTTASGSVSSSGSGSSPVYTNSTTAGASGSASTTIIVATGTVAGTTGAAGSGSEGGSTATGSAASASASTFAGGAAHVMGGSAAGVFVALAAAVIML